jgi:hypothetical protein
VQALRLFGTPYLDIHEMHDAVSGLKMTPRSFSRQLAKAKRATSRGEAIEVSDEDTGEVFVFSLKRQNGWHFAPDAIGVVEGPADLSQRKGLSGKGAGKRRGKRHAAA